MQKKAISIVGIMGVGKTCIAKKIAKKLNFNCIDTDKEVKNITKFSVADLVKKNQEKLLQETEYKIIKKYSNKNYIISTGDYTINNQAAWDYLQHHTITIWMNIALNKIAQRLKPTENRPFLEEDFDEIKLKEIYNNRKKRYSHAIIELKNLNKKTLENLISTLNQIINNNLDCSEKITISNTQTSKKTGKQH